MTCKQLTEKLQSLNEGMKIEVKKVTECGRITGTSTGYQLIVGIGKKFYIGAIFEPGEEVEVFMSDIVEVLEE